MTVSDVTKSSVVSASRSAQLLALPATTRESRMKNLGIVRKLLKPVDHG